jgi:ADP-ribose pyrophosphatase YjhB (NUDIX family)
VATFQRQIPDGDNRERLVCGDCGFVAYENPKVVVGAVVALGQRVLLCRRAIEPRRGFWTLPAGYMELGETIEDGARREAHEEANAHISLEGILGIYSIARIGQVQIFFRAGFADPAAAGFSAGPESLEVGLFAWDDIPWAEIAFPTVRWALDAWRANPIGALGAPGTNPPALPPGHPE